MYIVCVCVYVCVFSVYMALSVSVCAQCVTGDRMQGQDAGGMRQEAGGRNHDAGGRRQ
jgi:hypothetical protein